IEVFAAADCELAVYFKPPRSIRLDSAGSLRQAKSPRRSLARAGQLFPMISVCRCFARRVKFDEKAAKRIGRIRTAFAICGAAKESHHSFTESGLKSPTDTNMRVFCPTCQLRNYRNI